MNDQVFAEKFGKVEDINKLVAELRIATDDDAVFDILKRHDVQITASELKSLISTDGELSADDLDDVTGGCGCGLGRKIIVKLVNIFLGMLGTDVRMSCH